MFSSESIFYLQYYQNLFENRTNIWYVIQGAASTRYISQFVTVQKYAVEAHFDVLIYLIMIRIRHADYVKIVIKYLCSQKELLQVTSVKHLWPSCIYFTLTDKKSLMYTEQKFGSLYQSYSVVNWSSLYQHLVQHTLAYLQIF